jgi:glycosyltransferase involved in cell wall biosynthesis/trans-aconitate methyltransferase
MSTEARATIVIPAYEPTPALADLVADLSSDGRPIIVVDDGSSEAAQDVLARVAAERGVSILRHAVNLGKGQALKTAFNHVLLHEPPDSVGVVTADADGQHLPADIRRVAGRLEQSRGALVLGSRRFDGRVPLRSRFGNTVTRGVFQLLLGRPIVDTQTGLRGIPRSFLPELLAVEAGRYEFELEMLVRATARALPIVEVPIRTVYGGAGQSHFNPLRDSLRIYFVFLRFLGLSLATAGLDYLVFLASYLATHNLLASTALARGVAGVFNFSCNRLFVFRSRGVVRHEVLKYVLLVFTLMWISYGLVTSLVIFVGIGVYVAKLLADGALFVASFAVQNLFVFTSRERAAAAATDWDSYYRRPAAFAPITRRITARKLLALVDRFAAGATLQHIVELGGGNSAFVRRFCERHPDAHFTAVDNNALGLRLLARQYAGHPRLTTVQQDVLAPAAARDADLVFSAGLIEHFDPAGTGRAIAAHFEQARPGGLVIITYPTPTWLYRAVRGAAERLGVWAFPDERPLRDEEVVREASRHGEVLDVRTNWAIVLTQGILVARRRGLQS